MKDERGLTYVEITVTIAIIGILFTFAGVALSRLNKSLASSTTDREITNILTTAARKARHGANNGPWGVYIPFDETTRISNSAILFQGTSYATRNAAYDVTYTVNNNILFTSVDFSGAATNATNSHEIVFQALTGSTTGYGSMTLSWYENTKTISVTPDGLIVRQ